MQRRNTASQALEKASALLKVAQSSPSRYSSPRSSPSRNHSASQINSNLYSKHSDPNHSHTRSKKYDWEASDDEDASLFRDSDNSDLGEDSDKDDESVELKAYLDSLAKKKAVEKAAGKDLAVSNAKSSYIKKPPPSPLPTAKSALSPSSAALDPPRSEALDLRNNSIKPSTPKAGSIPTLNNHLLESKLDNASNTSINSRIDRISEAMNASKSLLGENKPGGEAFVGELESDADLSSHQRKTLPARRTSSSSSTSPLRVSARHSSNGRNAFQASRTSDSVSNSSSASDLNTSEMGSSRSLVESSVNRKDILSSNLNQEYKAVSADSLNHRKSDPQLRVSKTQSDESEINGLISDTKSLLITGGKAETANPMPATKPVKARLSMRNSPPAVSEISEHIFSGDASSIIEDIEVSRGDTSDDEDSKRSKFNDLLTIEDLDVTVKPKQNLQETNKLASSRQQEPSKFGKSNPNSIVSEGRDPPLVSSFKKTEETPAMLPPPPPPPPPPQLPPKTNSYHSQPQSYPYSHQYPYPPGPSPAAAAATPPPPSPFQIPPPQQYWPYHLQSPYIQQQSTNIPSPFNPMFSLYGTPIPIPSPYMQQQHQQPNLWIPGGMSSAGGTTFVNPPYLDGNRSLHGASFASGGGGGGRRRDGGSGLRRENGCDHSCGCIPPDEKWATGRRSFGRNGGDCGSACRTERERDEKRRHRRRRRKNEVEEDYSGKQMSGVGEENGSRGKDGAERPGHRRTDIESREKSNEKGSLKDGGDFEDISSYGGDVESPIEVEEEDLDGSRSEELDSAQEATSTQSSHECGRNSRRSKQNRRMQDGIESGRQFRSDVKNPLMSSFESANFSMMAAFAPNSLAVNTLLQNHLNMIQEYVRMNERLLQEEIYSTKEYVTLKSTKEEIRRRRKEEKERRAEFEREVEEAQSSMPYE
ncbi:hypothetical protein BDR26DRAFT_865792 [Obelidium mucronatum]|nr:hypothetical protein BDR26DRAFT_865792 [Obelidium mucronatum]